MNNKNQNHKDCNYRALLNRYQDSELDESSRREFEAHLSNCPQCREQSSLWTSMQETIKGFEEVDTDLNFNARLMAEIHQKKPVHANGWWKIFPGLRLPLNSVVYSLVFVVFLVVGFWVQNSLTTHSATQNNPVVQLQEEQHLSDILSESQHLSLLTVQRQSLDLLNNYDNTDTINSMESGDLDE
jgi:anti-sigma factor RsiW